MEQVRFGRTELAVSRLCFGCVSFGVRDPSRHWDPFTADGQAESRRVLRCAVDTGITIFDTSPDYGDGHAERVLGAALKDVREDVVIATKVDYGGMTADQVAASVEGSLTRLDTDYIDIIQFHGGNYPPSSVKRILDKGLLERLLTLRAEGRVRFIGLTVSDPVTARSLMETGAFDSVQMLYNLVEQAAARHALKWAQDQDMGVTVMRPLAAGMLNYLFAAIAPDWLERHSAAEVCLKFLLSDRRVHTINVGMRSEAEIIENARLVETYRPTIDIAALPRSVGQAART